MNQPIGRITEINGPIVEVTGIRGVGLMEVVEVGHDRLVGELIKLQGEVGIVQVYESTSGLRPGEDVFGTEAPLSVELGPGLLGNIFDGIQRPLVAIKHLSGPFIQRGVKAASLDRGKKWHFNPSVRVGQDLAAGSVVGSVQETPLHLHQILAPPDVGGKVEWVAPEGDYTIEETVVRLSSVEKDHELKLYHRWPVRRPRLFKSRLLPKTPLISGQRVIDTLYPIAKGGTAMIPGGFGTGKTITQQQLAKWSDADIIVYIGCGERGNEITEVLLDFPKLVDPRSGRPLMERTVLVANTSNMPVAAREASIYTGITIAEYFRDQGKHVALMADSTSRWAEALREISSRLEEVPAEEGFPAYLPSRLAEFYERAGHVNTLARSEGSVTIVGAVSPPGGDFSEPVTQHTRRFTRCFWALDKALASARHFPAINWLDSYSGYVADVSQWWEENVGAGWLDLRERTIELLQREDRLQEIAKLVGPDALPDEQRLILDVAAMLREGFLQQNALDPVDTYATPRRQLRMLSIIMHFYDRAKALILMGCPVIRIREMDVIPRIMRMRFSVPNEKVEELDGILAEVDSQMDSLAAQYRKAA